MSIKAIIELIEETDLTSDDMKSLVVAFRRKREVVNMEEAIKAKRALKPGMRVFYVNRGRRSVGTVVRINITKAVVKVDGDVMGNWNVPLGWLKPLEKS